MDLGAGRRERKPFFAPFFAPFVILILILGLGAPVSVTLIYRHL